MNSLSKSLNWLKKEKVKDHKEVKKYKNKLIDEISISTKEDILTKKKIMPQFSEEYLEERYNEKKPLLEGYLSHFLRVSEFIDEFPFGTSGDTIVEIIIPEPAFLKILREIEEVNSPEGVVVHLSEIPEEYQVKIGNTFFKFKKS
jgi:hypothetical protein